MKSKVERANELGIYLPHYNSDEHRTTCPNCSNTRRKKNDNCLSVTVTHDAILWFCHHCEWQGGAKDMSQVTTFSPKIKNNWINDHTKVEAKVIPIASHDNHKLSDSAKLWLHNRKISSETAETFKLFTKDNKLCFPYYLDGELVNIKYRTKDKKFLQEKNATKCLYNIDMLKKSITVE